MCNHINTRLYFCFCAVTFTTQKTKNNKKTEEAIRCSRFMNFSTFIKCNAINTAKNAWRRSSRSPLEWEKYGCLLCMCVSEKKSSFEVDLWISIWRSQKESVRLIKLKGKWISDLLYLSWWRSFASRRNSFKEIINSKDKTLKVWGQIAVFVFKMLDGSLFR